jgi:small conductance mechanosensitive channel
MTSRACAWDVLASDNLGSIRPFLDFLASLIPGIAAAAGVLLITYVVSRLASGRLERGLERGGFQVNVAILLSRALWAALWIVGFLIVLNLIGVGLTPLAAFVGVVGLAASLSLQSVLQNLVAGVYLLAERPFAIGDFIAVIGPGGVNHEGEVEDIQMRTTHLRSRDKELILVPNSTVFSGVVTNRTAVGGFVQHLTVTFPRDRDPEDARSGISDLLQQLPAVVTPPQPQLRVTTVDSDTWTAAVSLWVRDPDASAHASWAIARAFPEATVNASGVTL